MVAPLGAPDRIVLGHRWIARKVAARLVRLFPVRSPDDVEAAGWSAIARAVRRYDPARGGLESFLYAVALNAALRLLRRERARGMRFADRLGPARVVPVAEVAVPDRPPPERWEDADWLAAVAGLAPRRARAVLMRFRDGAGYDTIAESVGYASPRAARAAVSKGLAQLRGRAGSQ